MFHIGNFHLERIMIAREITFVELNATQGAAALLIEDLFREQLSRQLFFEETFLQFFFHFNFLQ